MTLNQARKRALSDARETYQNSRARGDGIECARQEARRAAWRALAGWIPDGNERQRAADNIEEEIYTGERRP